MNDTAFAREDAHPDDRLAYVALVLSPGVGQMRALRAISRLGRPRDLFTSNLTQVEGLGIPANGAAFIADGKARTTAEEEIVRVHQAGGDFLTHDDALYPERLREIYDPPAVLWYRGNPAILNDPGIAVVGTRHPTAYGQGMAQLLSRDLAHRGMLILSGMARGMDTLEANGKTVAVWGTGIDVIYPKENKRLAEDILQSGGCILSEYPLGTFPAPQNFPVRNRILSGMSVGVLVVEAAEHSGTRITARCAIEQDRDVYAVPGNVTNKSAWRMALHPWAVVLHHYFRMKREEQRQALRRSRRCWVFCGCTRPSSSTVLLKLWKEGCRLQRSSMLCSS